MSNGGRWHWPPASVFFFGFGKITLASLYFLKYMYYTRCRMTEATPPQKITLIFFRVARKRRKELER